MTYAAAQKPFGIPPDGDDKDHEAAWQKLCGAWPLVRQDQCVTRLDARAEVNRALRQKYGSMVILGFLFFTIAGAALSWLIERLLDKWFPPHKGGFGDSGAPALMDQWAK